MRVDHRNNTHSNIVEDLRYIVLAAEMKQRRETERVYEGGGGVKGTLKTFVTVDDAGVAADGERKKCLKRKIKKLQRHLERVTSGSPNCSANLETSGDPDKQK